MASAIRATGLGVRVEGEQVSVRSGAGERIRRCVVPDVGALPAELAQVDVAAMSASAVLEQEDQLMRTAIEAPHPAVALGPYAEIH